MDKQPAGRPDPDDPDGRESRQVVALRLEDTLARSQTARMAAQRNLRYARAAIATAQDQVRRARAAALAVRGTIERHQRLTGEWNARG
jgi:hypothetical protein